MPGFRGGTYQNFNVQYICPNCHSEKTRLELGEYYSTPRVLDVSPQEFWPEYRKAMPVLNSIMVDSYRAARGFPPRLAAVSPEHEEKLKQKIADVQRQMQMRRR